MSSPTSRVRESVPGAAAMAPLSGALEFSPGSVGRVRSYLLPSFQYTGYADTNSAFTTAPGTLDTRSTLVGSITLQRVWRRAQFNLDYAGGALLYGTRYDRNSTAPLPSNGMMHRLSFSQTFSSRRWTIFFGDSALYLPESPFGFAGFGGLESFGGGLGGGYLSSAGQLSPMFMPSQTILTGTARRVSSASIAQVQYNAGSRSAITATGSYGILHFLDSGFISSEYWTVLTGYNHAVTRKDTVAITYAHSWVRFSGVNREILNRGLMLSYGRRITGKLALELSAGSLVNMVAKPMGGSTTHAFWSTYDSLQYQFRKGNLGFSFMRYMTGGSGLLLGAETNLAQMTLGHQLPRRFFGSLSLGHAYSQSLTQDRAAQRDFKYESWQGGSSLSREFGPHTSVYLNYDVQRQISNNPSCFGNNCGRVTLRHVAGVGINLHSRPVRID